MNLTRHEALLDSLRAVEGLASSSAATGCPTPTRPRTPSRMASKRAIVRGC